jgi:UDP-N-acetylmuramoylalanine--D-glutamate ligase
MAELRDPLRGNLPWQGRRVGVLGLGISGRAAARLLLERGARVVAFDDRPASEFTPETLTEARRYEAVHMAMQEDPSVALDAVEALVCSPGIAATHPVLAAAERRGIPTLSEIELATRLVRGPVIAITGTNGKSTTATLIHQCVRGAGLRASLGGNIGTAASDLVGGLGDEDILVLEISSFQLERIQSFHPRVAVLTNIAPDHLNRYDGVAAYAAAKHNILMNADAEDFFVFPAGDVFGEAWAVETPARSVRFAATAVPSLVEGGGDGSWVQDGFVMRRFGGRLERVIAVDELTLSGLHNYSNVCASVCALAGIEISTEQLATALRHVEALPHRNQLVLEHNGLRFVDDSKATNVHAAATCLAASEAPVVALLGGRGKGEDYTPLRDAMQSVRLAICYGEEGPALEAALTGLVETSCVESLAKALALVEEVALNGDLILLSPACASFDEFRSFEHRGDFFRAWALRWGGSR